MKSAETAVLLVVGLVVLAGAVALFAGAFGMSSEVVVQDGSPAPPPPVDGTSGVVAGKNISGGLSIVRVVLRPPDYNVDVSVVANRECVWLDGDEEKLRSTGECADVPVVGPIVGSGRTAEGNDFFMVRVDVSEPCYDTIAVGDLWPTDLPDCR